jgi:hypothetical protein
LELLELHLSVLHHPMLKGVAGLAQCHRVSQAHSPPMAASLGKVFVKVNKQWKAQATLLSY